MILVDTSVWIDFLKGTKSREEIILKKLIEEEEDICITGIILTEILQGVKNDFKYKEIKKFLLALPIFFP
ncbi:MAG: PIN domain-containing protein, partial [Deltaproteobacteria bacterium]|nr:PIN domain-containing protein [Deltaproteobacteria bacterium]